MGSCLGDMTYAVGSLSLVSLLLAHRDVRIALWLGGSAVLLWLALKMLRETWHPRATVDGAARRARRDSAAA